MGGNVLLKVGTRVEKAEPLVLTLLNPFELQQDIIETLEELNGSNVLWEKGTSISRMFSGSSYWFMLASKETMKYFVELKPSLGDVDVQVPENKEKEILQFLEASCGSSFGSMVLLGFKRSGKQLVCLWYSRKLNQNVQIDFELVEFENSYPSQWAMFSHSSPAEDFSLGIKGVAHKLAIRALTAKDLQDVDVIRGKKQKHETISTMAFSVLHGLRKKIEPVAPGVVRFIPTNKSTYITSPSEISKILLGKESNSIYSFVGIVDAVRRQWEPVDQYKFFDGMVHSMWGSGVQGFSRLADVDRMEKEKIVAHILDKLPVPDALLDKMNEMKTEYYKSYNVEIDDLPDC